MAEEEDSSQEKTEEATPRRLEKSREEGQVARSKELATMAVLMAGAAALLMFGTRIGASFERIMRESFQLERAEIFDTHAMALALLDATIDSSLSLWPFLLILAIAAVIGPVAIGGFLFSGKAITPKFSRINPLAGLKRMFSARSLVELIKAIAKVALVMVIAILILEARTEDLLRISREPTEPAMAHVVWTLAWSFFFLSCAMIVIAAVDVPFQIFEHHKKLRMTKQEVKDEYKESEGKPEVKGRIRQLQREMANRRMMQDVPTADVVITNPTHYAVALKYDAEKMGAPTVVARGVDEVAMKIQEIAREHKVEVLRTPPLARAIYHSTDVGEEIPAGLYVAVAQVLAYLFQLRNFRKGQGARPNMPKTPIPPEFRRDD